MRLNRQQLHELRAGRKPCLYTKDHPGHEIGLNRKVTNVDERVVVLEVSQVKVAELTGQHARLAGFESRAELMQSLGYTADGPRADLDFECWETVLERDPSHHPRLLHKDASRGYTENPHLALQDEPEAVEREYLDRFSREAEDMGRILRSEQQAKDEARTYARRIRQSMLTATRQGKDTEAAKAKLDEALRDLDEAA
jgi:hypothetical protein